MANYCSIVNSKQYCELRKSLTETSIKRLYEAHNGTIPSVNVSVNEIYEEYGGIYGCVDFNNKLPRPNSFLEYSNYLRKKGINVLVGNKIKEFSLDYGYDAYSAVDNISKGIVVDKNDILHYSQQNESDYGFAIELAKSQNKKVLVYRTFNDGDIVITLSNSLDLVDVCTKEDIEMFEEWHKYEPNAIEKAFMTATVEDDFKDSLEDMFPDSHNAFIGPTFARLAKKLGVEYEVISVEDAIEKTKNAVDKFTAESTEPGFFYKGKIYLIEGRVNENTALHELSHFVVRAVRLQNKALFDEMFSDAIQSKEGRDILEQTQKRSEADFNADELKEEVLATLLKIRPKNEQNKLKRIIDNIWYKIKQIIRGMFGGNKLTKVSELNADTTLYQLAEMIQEGGIERISTRGMDLSNIVLYDGSEHSVKEYTFTTDEMRMLDEVFKGMGKNLKELINKLPKGKVYEFIESCGLVDELKSNIINAVPSDSMLRKKMYDTLDESVEHTVERMNTFVRVVNGLARTMININDMLGSIDVLDNVEKVSVLRFCINIVKSWESVLDNNQFDDIRDVEIRTMLSKRINNLNTLIRSNKNRIKRLERESLAEVLYSQVAIYELQASQPGSIWEPLLNPTKNAQLNPKQRLTMEQTYYGMSEYEYKEFLKLFDLYDDGKLKDQAQFDKFKKLCSAFSNGSVVNIQKMKLYIDGMLEDMGPISQWMDSYISSQDQFVAPFMEFIKNNYTKSINKSERFTNKVYDTIIPLMQKAGFGRGQEKQLMEALCFLDEVCVVSAEEYEKLKEEEIEKLRKEGITQSEKPDEYTQRMNEFEAIHSTGKTRTKVWTLLNEFKNYRADHDELRDNLKVATRQYESDRNKDTYKKYLDAYYKLQRFERVYMNKDYVDEVYSVDDLMQDDIGMEAMEQRDFILSRIHDLDLQRSYTADDDGLRAQKDALWREYALLHSDFDNAGNMKTGRELEIAQRLREYRDAKGKYFNRVIDIDSFIEDYRANEEHWAKEYGRDTAEYENAKNKWIQDNTVEAGSKLYKQKINEIYDKIAELRSDNNPELKKYWDRMLELIRPYRDETGAPEYLKMPKNVYDEIQDLMDKISNAYTISLENVEIKGKKLTKDEIDRYKMLYEDLQNNNTIPFGDDANFFYTVSKAMDNNEANTKLRDQYIQLSSLRISVPSKDYLSELNDILKSEGLYVTILNTPGIETDIYGITEDGAIEMLNNGNLIADLLQNSNFKKWFDERHTSKRYKDTTYYKRKFLFSTNKIADNDALKAKTEFTVNGKLITIWGVPNNSYSHLEIKKEYLNEKIEGVTCDNMGRWLPKSFQQMEDMDDEVFVRNKINPSERHKYHNEKFEDIKKNTSLNELLEAVKKIHLEGQENASVGAKLYYDVPRYAMDNYDIFKSDNKAENFLNKVRQSWGWKSSALAADRDNYNKNTFNLVQLGMVDEFVQPDAPIRGLFNIDYKYVSPNIIENMCKYNVDICKSEALAESNGVAESVVEAVNENDFEADKDVVNARGIFKRKKKHGGYGTRRARIINNIYDTEFKGKRFVALHGTSTIGKIVDNYMSKINKLASFSFFAFNWYSSTKNYTGQKFQQLVESVGNKTFTPLDMAKGEALSLKCMGLASTGYMASGHKDLYLQLVDVFDFIQGRQYERMGKEAGNSLRRAAFDFTFPTAMRKWGEYQATTQLGFAKLYGHKIRRVKTDKNNDEGIYNMTDIYELDDTGNIVLKDGFDIRYNVTSVYHVVDVDDTFESILKKYNIQDTEENRKAVFGNIDLAKMKEIYFREHARHHDKLDEINLMFKNNMISDETRQQMELDENERFRKKTQSLCSIQIRNTKFADVKNDISGTFDVCNGAYAMADANFLSRTILGKPFMALKKYFFPMFAHKYVPRSMRFERVDGKYKLIIRPRYDLARGTMEMPYILSAFISMGRLLTLKNPFTCDADKKNFVRATFEFVWTGIIVKLLVNMLFGLYGDDDDDDLTPEELTKYKRDKFKEMCPAATWWDMPDDFNIGGRIRQDMIINLLLFEQENSQFTTNWGTMIKDVMVPRIVTTGPTVDNYVSIASELVDIVKDFVGVEPENNLKYSRDVGPYSWQKKGQYKIFARLWRCLGADGKNIDAFKQYESLENVRRMGRSNN